MSTWYRVFSASAMEPDPTKLLEHLHVQGLQIPSNFRGDTDGWFELVFTLSESASPVVLERFLTTEEGIRTELNNWAAWLETCDYSPNHGMLMEKVIQSAQIFTLRRPLDHADESKLDDLCLTLMEYLAERTDGVYQIDGQGFFAADGELLLQEY